MGSSDQSLSRKIRSDLVPGIKLTVARVALVHMHYLLSCTALELYRIKEQRTHTNAH